LAKPESARLYQGSKLFKGDPVRIRYVLVDREYPTKPKQAKKFGQAGLRVRNLTEDGNQNRNVEGLVREGQTLTRVVSRVTNVSIPPRLQFSLRLCEHFGLNIEQLKTSLRNAAR